jgi:quinol monooxygenase YgiN
MVCQHLLWSELAAARTSGAVNGPACPGIRLHQDADHDTRFLLYERWIDRATDSGA